MAQEGQFDVIVHGYRSEPRIFKPLQAEPVSLTPLYCGGGVGSFLVESVVFWISNRWVFHWQILAKVGGNNNQTRSAAPGENPNANVLSMKCEGALPTNRQLAHISLTMKHYF